MGGQRTRAQKKTESIRLDSIDSALAYLWATGMAF
jgi:hypothetical protein